MHAKDSRYDYLWRPCREEAIAAEAHTVAEDRVAGEKGPAEGDQRVALVAGVPPPRVVPFKAAPLLPPSLPPWQPPLQPPPQPPPQQNQYPGRLEQAMTSLSIPTNLARADGSTAQPKYEPGGPGGERSQGGTPHHRPGKEGADEGAQRSELRHSPGPPPGGDWDLGGRDDTRARELSPEKRGGASRGSPEISTATSAASWASTTQRGQDRLAKMVHDLQQEVIALRTMMESLADFVSSWRSPMSNAQSPPSAGSQFNAQRSGGGGGTNHPFPSAGGYPRHAGNDYWRP